MPTAERDATIGLSIFQPLFRGVRAVMYNSPEERAMIHAVSGNQQVPGVVVGIGSDVPEQSAAGAVPPEAQHSRPVCRLCRPHRPEQGLRRAVRVLPGYLADPAGKLSLMLIGNSLLPIPDHPRIRHLGFLDDADKFDAMAAADLLIMPSYYESLSMVALEAWALGRPVLANGKCDVLKGQCIRSNAGLYYETLGEFVGTLEAIEQNRWLSGTLGRNGRQFFREHYDWPVIERKYLEMFERLKKEPAARTAEPLPGWFDRRRQDLPPAEEVLRRRPAQRSRSGDARDSDPSGAGDARLRRRDRPRGARHSARAASGRATSRRSSSRPPTTGSSR